MTDQRPPMWIGHTHMAVNDVAATKAFLLELGMRDVFPDGEDFAILEIRAGTHIIVEAAKEPVASGQSAEPGELQLKYFSSHNSGEPI